MKASLLVLSVTVGLLLGLLVAVGTAGATCEVGEVYFGEECIEVPPGCELLLDQEWVEPVFICPEPEGSVCDPHPAHINSVTGEWERKLIDYCYYQQPLRRIVWDDLGNGCTWSEFQAHLLGLGLPTEYEASVEALIANGYWTSWGARGEVPFPAPSCNGL